MSSEFGAGGDELEPYGNMWDGVGGHWGFDDLDDDDWYVNCLAHANGKVV